MSATRQAIASSAARPIWPARTPDVSPAMTARASERHQGAPSPASAGSTRTPPASSAAAAAAASAAGSSARPRSRLSHSSRAPAVKTPPSIAHSGAPPRTLQATVGSSPPVGQGALGAGVGEHEDPGSVGGLDPARDDAAGARQRSLLIDAACAQRQLDRPALVPQRAQVARSVGDLGQRLGGDPEYLQQAGVPVGCPELGAARRSRGRWRNRRRVGRRGTSRRSRGAGCRRRAGGRPRGRVQAAR